MPLPIQLPSGLTLPLSVANGGTGQTTATLARQGLGLAIGTDIPGLGIANTFTLAQTISATTQSTTTGTGALILSGGVGIAKNAFIGGIVDIADTTASTSSTTGALIVDGGAGIAKDSWINGVRVGRGAGSVASNTALGAGALDSMVSGSANVVIGTQAGEDFTNSNATMVGYAAGLSATSGGSSALIGYFALSNLTTATGCTALGHQAGRYLADGSTAFALTGNDNIFIGNNSRGSANDQTNSITIAGATGLSQGSNTTVLGNASTTASYLFGAPSGGGLIGDRLTGDFTTTLNTNTDTALSFAVAANEVWMLDIQLTYTAPAAGSRVQISTPAGAAVEGWAIGFSTAALTGVRITTVNTLFTIVAGAGTFSELIRVLVTNAGNAGTIALGGASVTGTQTTTFHTASHMRAQRVL